MKQAYINYNPSADTRALITFINGLIDQYLAQGFTLSVRQIYYQMVARDKIANTDRNYKRVASIINDARLGGFIDWDAIEDRNRDIEKRASWDSPASIVRVCARQFHMDMWEGQEYRPYVIVEKAALAGVMGKVCTEHDVPLLAARGYPSVSIVRELVRNYFWGPAIRDGQKIVVLHFGDHDPSGIDMTRDLKERIALFTEGRFDVEIKRLALNMDQIEEQQPPPNPAKMTDSRFNGYSERFGDESWELDALEPKYLGDLLAGEIEDLKDEDLWKQREDEIEAGKLRLEATADQYDEEDSE